MHSRNITGYVTCMVITTLFILVVIFVKDIQKTNVPFSEKDIEPQTDIQQKFSKAKSLAVENSFVNYLEAIDKENWCDLEGVRSIDFWLEAKNKRIDQNKEDLDKEVKGLQGMFKEKEKFAQNGS